MLSESVNSSIHKQLKVFEERLAIDKNGSGGTCPRDNSCDSSTQSIIQKVFVAVVIILIFAFLFYLTTLNESVM